MIFKWFKIFNSELSNIVCEIYGLIVEISPFQPNNSMGWSRLNPLFLDWTVNSRSPQSLCLQKSVQSSFLQRLLLGRSPGSRYSVSVYTKHSVSVHKKTFNRRSPKAASPSASEFKVMFQSLSQFQPMDFYVTNHRLDAEKIMWKLNTVLNRKS